MDKEVVLFTMNNCEHCNLVKERLLQENIVFYDMDILIHSETWESVVKQIGSDIVPVLIIPDKNQDGVADIFIPNVDFKSVDELVNIIKEH